MKVLDIKPFHGILRAAIEEDLGGGDVTSSVTVPASAQALARYVTKAPIVVSGLAVVEEVVRLCDESLEFQRVSLDGAEVDGGSILAEVRGNARAILIAERTSLNFLQRMSGIATATRRYVREVEGTSTKILDTRKTAPGHRKLDKYAVSCGGGVNHRLGLFDAILIKNNHVVFHSGVAEAVRTARVGLGSDMRIEVEVKNLEELREAIESGPDRILLDNFTPDQTRMAMKMVRGRFPVESSGRITLENVRSFAEAGVDYVSVGALTHSVAAADIHLQVTPC